MMLHVSLLKKKIIKVIYNDVQKVFYIKKKSFFFVNKKLKRKLMRE